MIDHQQAMAVARRERSSLESGAQVIAIIRHTGRVAAGRGSRKGRGSRNVIMEAAAGSPSAGLTSAGRWTAASTWLEKWLEN